MRGSAWVCLVVVVGLAGCDVPQEVVDDVTCTDLCRCIFGLPSSQARCKTQCLAVLTPIQDNCAQCVEASLDSCTTMVDDCLQLCSPVPTPLEGEP